MLREYEEHGSALTAGLIQERVRRESRQLTQSGYSGHEERTSMCLTNMDDLKEMGLDSEVQDYAKCFESVNSASSSMNSLSSNHMEDEEGFNQINALLVQKQRERRAKEEAMGSQPTSPLR